MAASPANTDNEHSLREFCQACLELLNRKGPAGTVLADMLPSFALTIRSCGEAAGRLDRELADWESRARRLMQLASLHCAEEAGGLVSSLKQISRDATSVVASLKSLGDRRDAAHETDDIELAAPQPVNDPLRDLCDALLSLLDGGPNGTSLVPQTLPSLSGLFAECRPVMLARLRAELHASRRLADELIPLAGPAFSDATALLAERVEQAQAAAERLIDSLESLARNASTVQVQTRNASNGSKDPEEELTGLAADPLAVECCRLALASQQRGDLATAETLLDEALRLDPTLRPAWTWRGRIHLQKGNALRAVSDETQALKLQDNEVQSLRCRGDALAICGRYHEALADYERALKIEPDCPRTRYNRAVMLRQEGRLDKAWAEFEQLLSHLPSRARVHSNRGLICAARGQADAAIKEFRASLAAQPGQETVIKYLRKLGVQEDDDPAKSREVQTQPEAARTVPPRTSPPRKLPPPSRIALTPSPPDRITQALRRAESSVKPSSKTVAAAQLETVVTSALDAGRDTPARVVRDDDVAFDLLSEAVDEPEPLPPLNPAPSDSDSAGTTEATLVSRPLKNMAAELPSSAELANALLTGEVRAPRPIAATEKTTEKTGSNLKVRCPACNSSSLLRYEQLEEGKTIKCRNCAANFAVQHDGHLAEVRRNWRGKWSVVRDQPAWWRDWRASAAASAAVVLLAVMSWNMYFQPDDEHVVIPEDPDFPRELEPRAQLFAQAWLKGDYRTMRQLTNENLSQELYLWVMDHPAPVLHSPATLERDAQFEVKIVDANPPHAHVAVYIEGLEIARGELISPLTLNWRQDEDRWAFQPASLSNL